MKRDGKIVVCTVVGLALGVGAQAVVNDLSQPYRSIVERNVFGLKDPTPPPTPPPETNPPPSNVKLTGITDILGRKQALFMVLEPAVPGRPAPTPQSCILTEGQKEGPIEVLEINQEAGTVKIINSGTTMLLDLVKDGNKLPNMPAPPVAMAGVPPPAPVAFVPHGVPPVQPGAQGSGVVTIGGGGTPAGGGSPQTTFAAGHVSTGLRPIPTRTLRTPPAAQPEPQPPALTPEEQIIIMEVERERHKNNPNYPPLPPTPLTPQ
jgi:hypothetical protein